MWLHQRPTLSLLHRSGPFVPAAVPQLMCYAVLADWAIMPDLTRLLVSPSYFHYQASPQSSTHFGGRQEPLAFLWIPTHKPCGVVYSFARQAVERILHYRLDYSWQDCDLTTCNAANASMPSAMVPFHSCVTATTTAMHTCDHVRSKRRQALSNAAHDVLSGL